jgi:hypothetical protein
MIDPLVQPCLDNRTAYLPSVPVGRITLLRSTCRRILLRALMDPGIELFVLISLTGLCTRQALPKELGSLRLGNVSRCSLKFPTPFSCGLCFEL